MPKHEYKLFAMPNSQLLGDAVAKQLKVTLQPLKFTRFADGEVMIMPEETVRNQDVYVIASTCPPVNENLMQLLVFVDALKRASANSITIALTYYGYARQDRKVSGRQPIAAKLVADILERAGVTKVIAVDLHSASVQGFFDIPVDNLRSIYIMASEIKKSGSLTVVSPDHGGAVRARALAELLGNHVNVAIVDKRRTGVNQTEVLNILGDVAGKNLVIVDDMIDTGGTIIKAAKALKQAGAKKIVVAATHSVFSKGFKELDECKDIEKVITTDSVPSVWEIKSKKLTVISLSHFIAEVISASVTGASISGVYERIRLEIK